MGKESSFPAHRRLFSFYTSTVPGKLGVYKLEVSSCTGRRGPLLAGFDTSHNLILRLRIKDDLVLEEWA